MACYELRVAQAPTDANRVGYQSLLTDVVADGVPVGTVQLDASRYRHRPLALEYDDSFWSAVAAWAVETSLRGAIGGGHFGRAGTVHLEINDYGHLATQRVAPRGSPGRASLEVGKPITRWDE